MCPDAVLKRIQNRFRSAFFALLMTALLILNPFGGIPAYAGSSLIEEGDALLQTEPPEYEKAAQLFRRAGLQGDGEGYYRLGQMYEEGLLVVGNPCTDDISALGKQKAEEWYRLAAENGYDGARAEAPGWESITQEEAKRVMEKTSCMILDVRTRDEYNAGHIPGAVCVPVETISDLPPEDLPLPEQTILVYCRSGNRSKQAAEKLAALGYTDILEFGGINTWDGGIISAEDGRALSDCENLKKLFSGELPLHLEYEILGDVRVETEEESWISLVCRRLSDVRIGDESELSVEDSGYWLTFTWKDGDTVSLIFETKDLFGNAGQNWDVIDDGGLFSTLSALCLTHETSPGRGGS